MAQVPAEKTDLRHYHSRDGTVRGPSVLSRREKGQRSSRMPGDGIVGGPSVPSRRGKRGDLQQYGILYIFVG